MKKVGLTIRIFIGLVLRIILSLIMNIVPAGYVKDTILIDGVFAVVGSGFIRFLMMVLVPVVFFSLSTGTSSLENVRTLGRIGSKTVFYYLSTTAIVICIALAVAVLVSPGVGVNTCICFFKSNHLRIIWF